MSEQRASTVHPVPDAAATAALVASHCAAADARPETVPELHSAVRGPAPIEGDVLSKDEMRIVGVTEQGRLMLALTERMLAAEQRVAELEAERERLIEIADEYKDRTRKWRDKAERAEAALTERYSDTT